MTMKPALLLLVEEDPAEEKEERRPLVSEVRVVARRVG